MKTEKLSIPSSERTHILCLNHTITFVLETTGKKQGKVKQQDEYVFDVDVKVTVL